MGIEWMRHFGQRAGILTEQTLPDCRSRARGIEVLALARLAAFFRSRSRAKWRSTIVCGRAVAILFRGQCEPGFIG